MRFIPYNNRAIELQRSEPYAIQFGFSALVMRQSSPNTHRGSQSNVPAVHREAVKLRTRHSQDGGQNSELIIKDTVGCQNWFLGHEQGGNLQTL